MNLLNLKHLNRLFNSKLALNLMSVSGATVFANLIGLITLGYSARILGPQHYGLIVFGMSVSAYASILISPGLIRWGMRAIAQERASAGENLVAINLTQFLLAFLGFVGLLAYGFRFLEGDERFVAILYGLGLFLTAIDIEFVYAGLELMRITALLSVVRSILYTVALLTWIRLPEHFYRLPLLTLGIGFGIQLILYAVLLHKYKVRLSLPPLTTFPKMYLASLPLGLASLITILYTYANNLFIKTYVGMAAVGIFYAAYRLIELTAQAFQVFSSVYLPRLSHQTSVDSASGKLHALWYVRILITIAFWLAPLLLVESPSIIYLIYGAEYSSAIVPLRLMSLVVVFMAAHMSYTHTLLSFRKDRQLLWIAIVTAVSVIAGGFFLIPRYGINAAALVSIFIQACGFLLALPVFRQIVGSYGFHLWLLPMLGGLSIVFVSIYFHATGSLIWFRVPAEILVYVPFAFLSLRPILLGVMGTLGARSSNELVS